MSRSSFVNMLSQYLKEQRNIADFPKFESKAETTMNLLPKQEFSEYPTADLFPRKPEIAEATQNAPLTIFFAGKMIVFNDFPAEKAKEIMNLASQGRSGNSAGSVSDSESSALNKLVSQIPDLNIASAFEAGQHGFDQNQSIGSNLPIANRNSILGQKTKSSLHRFFEKRKERVTARAPYQIHGRGSPFSKPDEECRRLQNAGLRDLELKL